LAYWQGKCPAHDISLSGATIIWSDILKNPSQSNSSFPVNLDFPNPVPMTGCVGLYFGGGPLLEGKATMSADLSLTYQPVTNANPNTVLDVGGEYCFGQTGGCQNATDIDGEGFAVPIPMMTAGHLLELYGNISDSSFDGTNNFGPIPTGEAWGASNDFYLLPGGCGIFERNLNDQGFPNPAPLSTLHGGFLTMRCILPVCRWSIGLRPEPRVRYRCRARSRIFSLFPWLSMPAIVWL
jgi:hypothetical protein